MRSTRTILPLIAILLLSFATVGYLFARGHKVQSKQGFTLYMTQTAYPSNRPPILVATTVRYQKADGSWKIETTYSNGRKDEGFGQPARGVFHIDEKNQRLDYLSESGHYPPTEDEIKSNSNFVGAETILGYKTLHTHSNADSDPGNYADFYICPALQSFPIRSITGSKDGSRTVFDTTQIVIGEPSFTVPSYPVDMGRYNQVHGSGSQ